MPSGRISVIVGKERNQVIRDLAGIKDITMTELINQMVDEYAKKYSKEIEILHKIREKL